MANHNQGGGVEQLRQEKAQLESMLRVYSQQHVMYLCVRSEETPEVVAKIRTLERQRESIAKRLSLVNCMYCEQCSAVR